MALEIGFSSPNLSAGSDPQQGLQLPMIAGRVCLPDLTLTTTDGRAAYLDHLAVTGAGESATATALAESWQASDRAINPVLRIPATWTAVAGPGPVELSIVVSYREQDIAGNWLRPEMTPPARRTVRVAWGPGGAAGKPATPEPAEATTATQNETAASEPESVPDPSVGTARPSTEVHHGIAAIDFGTTACTVTLWDEQHARQPVLPESQAQLLRDETIALLSAKGPLTLNGAWEQLTQRVAATVQPSGGDLQSLVAALSRGTTSNSNLLQETLKALESQSQYTARPSLRAWLTESLHRMYAQTLAAPAPEHWQLWLVPFGVKDEPQVPATVSVSRTSKKVEQVGQPIDDPDGEKVVLPSLKRHFGRDEAREVAELGLATDEVIAEAIGWLIGRTNEFILGTEGLDHHRLNRVVCTYPTAMPGAARRRLQQLVASAAGVNEVNIRYDEAIAAGFYFLMRDIGSDRELGIEALWARMRPTENPGVRTENLLVVDIGGGTTDIALFTMNLQDATPHLADVPPHRSGRYYRISPELRGSNGWANRGGDYLTLCVFHLLKATVADALLRSYPQEATDAGHWLDERMKQLSKIGEWWDDQSSRYRPGSLIEAEFTHLKDNLWKKGSITGPAHRAVVEQVVPTRWRDASEEPAAQRRRSAFNQLWRLAEAAKIGPLGNGRDYTVPQPELASLIGFLTGQTLTADVGRLRTEPLGATTFAEVAGVLLKKLANLAAALVNGRFEGSPQRIDRLVLTGRASSLDLVREVFGEVFAESAARHGLIEWDPTALQVDQRGAKSATSIGAVWAERMRLLSRRPENAEDVARAGNLEIRVEVDNVFQTLPATFTVTRSSSYETVFQANQEFEVESGDRRRLEYPLKSVPRVLNIHRKIDGDDPMLWGSFDPAQTARNEGYEPAIPSPDAKESDDLWLARIQSRVEINPHLELTLHLWNVGDNPALSGPAQVVDGPATPLTAEKPTNLLDLARRLRVRIGNADDRLGRVVFPGDGELTWTHVFAESENPKSPLRRGLVSSQPLPRAGSEGWQFFLTSLADREPGQPGERVDERVASPAVAVLNGATGWYASLDEAGQLRVHPGKPRYLKASSLREMDDNPGAVFSTPMSARGGEDESSDPFNGLQ
ncbi:hypothetical protein [Kineosporia babensis]|uniref:Molecular chaperone n=1 Tax=Kineosporia babensis TaxID=499548 RepID=A0A9X1NDD2_9ACTN|nr:hypothetical protein [Kineosporia babensis]MCD5312035.1 hypothetical protein [Kineosporia babensis]